MRSLASLIPLGIAIACLLPAPLVRAGDGLFDLGSDPSSEPEAEPEPTPEEKNAAYFKGQLFWPGPWVGIRAGYSLGNALVPTSSLGAGVGAREGIAQMTPYFGAEFGYVPPGEKWGAAIAFDAGFLTAKPDFLNVPPLHLLAGFMLVYVPGDQLRWFVGLNPFTSYRMVFPGGQVFTLGGLGARVGVNYRLTDVASQVLEGFAYLSMDRFTRIDAGIAGQTRNYDIGNFVGPDNFSGIVMLVVGLQFNLGGGKAAPR